MCGRYFPRLARQYSVQRPTAPDPEGTPVAALIWLLEVTSFWVTLARRTHPFPSRTRQLSSSAPMVLHAQVCGRVGRRPVYFKAPNSKAFAPHGEGLLSFSSPCFRRFHLPALSGPCYIRIAFDKLLQIRPTV